MKLNELFDTKTKKRSVNDLSKYNYRKRYRVDTKGFGGIARVQDKKTDPFLVSKIPYEAKENLSQTDGYYCYISEIVDNKIAQRNPFAPRIYKINKFKSLSGAEKYTVDMEKLIPANEVETEDIKTCYRNLFDEEPVKNNPHITFVDVLAQAISTQNSNNDDLKELLKIIKKIKSEHEGFWMDIHRQNIMFRRGPYGVQLVLTDPLGP